MIAERFGLAGSSSWQQAPEQRDDVLERSTRVWCVPARERGHERGIGAHSAGPGGAAGRAERLAVAGQRLGEEPRFGMLTRSREGA